MVHSSHVAHRSILNPIPAPARRLKTQKTTKKLDKTWIINEWLNGTESVGGQNKI